MTRIPSALAVLAIAAALSSVASAQSFAARFAYKADLSVGQNYAAYQRIAQKACRSDVRNTGGLANQRTIQEECTSKLLTDAVAASGQAELVALHKQQIGAGALVATAH
jgi:hypothetical protein